MKKSKKDTKVLKMDAIQRKKLSIFLICCFSIFVLLILRLGYLQFVQGAWLSQQASAQQTTTKALKANRGTIFDTTGKRLSVSMETDTVSVNTSKVKYKDDTDVELTFLVHSLSEILGINYDETLEKLTDATTYITVATKVDSDTITALEEWMDNNDISSGIRIESTVSRFYPYSTLASNLIGFVGTDGQGLFGLEYTLDDILSGTDGKVVTLTDSINGEIPNEQKTYIAAQDGQDVYLTIDVTIQSIVEKYLSQAVIDNKSDGGTAIVMDPSNGDILAMATYPNYDLNSPFVPTDSALLENWDKLTASEKSDTLYAMWNNSAVEKTYEPGSTFKIITAAAGLEEGLISPDSADTLYCKGHEVVSGKTINCWRHYDPHGYQTLRKALANSCNPAFIQLGQKIGAQTLYKYYRAFGLFEKTNSMFYGEANSIFFSSDNVTDLNLATMSFGQRITVTPIQLITAVSAIANEGVLVQPRIVKQTVDPQTNAVTTIEPTEVRQVISKETASEMMSMLESVVTDGTGRHSKVEGYSIGGKSGTSEPIWGDEESGYVASFIAVSPTTNAQVIILVALYDPKGDSYQGGEIAGPVVAQILGETLPYLGIASDSSETGDSDEQDIHTLPDVRNLTIKQATDKLKNLGFDVHISGDEDIKTTLVTDQMPKPRSFSIRRF